MHAGALAHVALDPGIERVDVGALRFTAGPASLVGERDAARHRVAEGHAEDQAPGPVLEARVFALGEPVPYSK